MHYIRAESHVLTTVWTLGIVSLMAASCVHRHMRTCLANGDVPDRLVESSRNDERARWWTAVQQLGELARDDETSRQRVWSRARVNTVGMKFVELSPGTFTMGPDTHRIHNIQVAHKVKSQMHREGLRH